MRQHVMYGIRYRLGYKKNKMKVNVDTQGPDLCALGIRHGDGGKGEGGGRH